jgi:hypothetical protein
MGSMITMFADVQTPLINSTMLIRQHENCKAKDERTWIWKSHISRNNYESISHNVIQSCPLSTKCLLKFVCDKEMGVLPNSLWHMWPILFYFSTNSPVIWLLKHLNMVVEKLTPVMEWRRGKTGLNILKEQ